MGEIRMDWKGVQAIMPAVSILSNFVSVPRLQRLNIRNSTEGKKRPNINDCAERLSNFNGCEAGSKPLL